MQPPHETRQLRVGIIIKAILERLTAARKHYVLADNIIAFSKILHTAALSAAVPSFAWSLNRLFSSGCSFMFSKLRWFLWFPLTLRKGQFVITSSFFFWDYLLFIMLGMRASVSVSLWFGLNVRTRVEKHHPIHSKNIPAPLLYDRYPSPSSLLIGYSRLVRSPLSSVGICQQNPWLIDADFGAMTIPPPFRPLTLSPLVHPEAPMSRCSSVASESRRSSAFPVAASKYLIT